MVYPGQTLFTLAYISKNRNVILLLNDNNIIISVLVELLSFAFLCHVWVTAVSPKMILVIVAPRTLEYMDVPHSL